MYLLIKIFKKSEFMAAQRARPILLNERFLVYNNWRASEASEPLSYCKLRFAIYIYLYIFSYVRQNFDLRMRSFTHIARGNFRTLPVFYL